MYKTASKKELSMLRKYLGNQFVYSTISQRAGGLSIGLNLNPDKACNFDCLYCEINRDASHIKPPKLDIQLMIRKLKFFLTMVQQGKLCEISEFSYLPKDLLDLRQVALSGDGEPTYCPYFLEIMDEISLIRANSLFPVFKLVLVTNGTGLHLGPVCRGLQKFLLTDEIWIKLDGGTSKFLKFINRPKISISTVLENIITLGRMRPIIIQSLFCQISGEGPDDLEIAAYIQRLNELKGKGAQISLVQIYSTSRPPINTVCSHLPLKRLSEIAKQVRENTGLKTEIF